MKTEHDLALPSELAEGYQATFTRLCRMFRARGVPVSETADLAQETIARTLLHLSRRGMLTTAGSANTGQRRLDGPPDGGIEPLIKRIAVNLLIDRARAAAPQLLPIEGVADLPEPGLDPGDEVARRQQRAQVHRAIDDLSARHRTAMLLSLEGLSPAEIADHLGIQRNAADALLYRARRSLAKHLSAITGLIRGLALAFVLRLRGLGRRNEASAFADATLAGQAVLGITAATLGTVLAFSLPQAPSADAAAARPAAPASHGSTSTGLVTTQDDVTASAASPDEPDRAAVRPDAAVDVDDHSVRTGATFDDPASGDEEGFGIGLDHRRDEDDRGVTGPLLDRATDAACGTTKTCEE